MQVHFKNKKLMQFVYDWRQFDPGIYLALTQMMISEV
jgi:hypothetical protein